MKKSALPAILTRASLALIGAACALTACAPASAPVVAPRAWEHESSDVPVDESLHFGRLANGLRFAWASNPEPDQRSYVRLHVDVGSLAEEDAERGMAHFLEHMVFAGTANFPAASLAAWLESHGMPLGADANAHTAFSETVYKLDLPQSDAETLRSGLAVLRDFADRAVLGEAEIIAEKGVVDGEERASESAQRRVLERQLELMYRGTRAGVRMPIGDRAARANFDKRAVEAFYRKWYRPDRMTLIAVGDLEGLDPEPLIRAAFGDMSVPAGEPPVEPGPGAPKDAQYSFAVAEPEISTVSVFYQRLVPYEDKPMNSRTLVEDLPLEYARSVLNLRFAELAQTEDAPFLSATCSLAGGLEVYDGESLTIVAPAESWEEAFRVCELELRRALEFGFQQAELDEIRANRLSALDQAVEREGARHSLAVTEALLSAAENRSVVMSARTKRDLLAPAEKALTAEQCLTAFRRAWSEGDEALYALGNVMIPGAPQAHLERLLAESRAVAAEPPKEVAVATFAYGSSESDAGAIAERDHLADLDVHRVRFENGVRLNVKPTDFELGQIMVGLRVGEGELSVEPESFALSFAAKQSFGQMGLEAHSGDDLRRLTAGRQATLAFSVLEDRFALGGTTNRADLLLQCEILSAHLSHPGWREEGLRPFLRAVPEYYQSMESAHQGPIQQEFLPALYGQDPRVGLPPREKLEAVGIDSMRAWIGPQLAEGPLEVTVIGDLDVEATIAACARTFGALPPRRDAKPFAEHRVFPAAAVGLSSDYSIASQAPQSLVLAVIPTTDGTETTVRRRLTLLARILNERVREALRTELGLDYTPASLSQVSRIHDGRGLIMLQVMTEVDRAHPVRDAARAVVRAVFENGVLDEEIGRQREALLGEIRANQRTNRFWSSVLANLQRDLQSLEDLRTAVSGYEAITKEDLDATARAFLDPERVSTAVVSPR